MVVENCLHHAYLIEEGCDIRVPGIVICINANYYLLTRFYPGGEERPKVVPKLLPRVQLVSTVWALGGKVSPVLLNHQ